jgi:hypothetical protein
VGKFSQAPKADANDVDVYSIEWGFKDQYGNWHFFKLNVPPVGQPRIPDPYLVDRQERLKNASEAIW